MEGTYIMGNETEERPAKQQCLSPRGGARIHAPARSPGDSTLRPTTTTPATAPRSDIDEDSEADMGFVVDTFSPDEMMDATAPERYAHDDIQNDWGFLEGHDLGMHPEKDPFTLDVVLEMTWA